MRILSSAGCRRVPGCCRGLFTGEPRRLVWRWGIILGLGLLCWFAYPQVYGRYHDRRAAELLKNQDCAPALRHVHKCLHVWPESARHHILAARCSWREGDPETAERHLQEAARLEWPAKDVNMESLFITAQQHLTRALEASLKDVLQFAKDNEDGALEAVVLEAVVSALIRAQRYQEAAFLAEVLAQVQPDTWRPLWLVGRAQEIEKPNVAAGAYRHSLKWKADQPQVHRWLAIYYARAAMPHDALRHFRAAQPLAGHDADATLAAAKAHYWLGDLAEARATVDRHLAQRGERDPWALALRGLIELQEHGPEAARPWLAKAEARGPYHGEVLNALFVLATREGDAEQARQCQERQERQKQAAAELPILGKKMHELYQQPNPDRLEIEQTAFRVGTLTFEIGEDDTAVKWMESVLADNPRHGEAHQALAAYYERRGDIEKAQAHRRQAVNRPSNP